MAKNTKRKGKEKQLPLLKAPKLNVKQETAKSIYGVISLIVAVLFLLAPMGIGGRVGEWVFASLGSSGLFGLGYFLIPLVFTALAIGFFRQNPEEGWGGTRIIGAAVLFLSGISVLSLAGNQGGSAGKLIASLFLYPLDYAFSFIALSGLAVVGALLALDTPLTLPSISFLDVFKKKESELDDAEEEIKVTGRYKQAPAEEEEEEEEQEEDEPAPVLERAKKEKKPEPIPQVEVSAIAFKPVDQAYNPPPVSLLKGDRGKPDTGDIKASANLIKRTLQNFGINVEMDEVSIGPTVTRYALKPAEGVRLQKILALQNNLELALAASPIRIEAPIPGKSLVGIEVPNTTKSTVGLGSLLGDAKFRTDQKPLTVALGRDITGNSHFANLGKMPHLLVAGATGSGKSVAIHALITSLLYRNGPATLRFIMVDPKRVELTLYNPIPHLLTPVITDPKKAILSLKWAAKEMERRYTLLEGHAVRDIHSYHENIVAKWKEGDGDAPDQMPYILIFIDELADIMQTYPRELEAAVVRLAQMSRAVGIHLILSTQRPSVNVITGLIKANVPARIALQVASQFDSRTILDAAGAEKLLGAGDMLYQSSDMPKPHRIQTAFISETEVKEVVEYIRKHNEPSVDGISLTGTTSETANPIFSASLEDEEDGDDLFEEAKQIVEEAGKASTSYLQRKLRIGYARAARLMDILEGRGVIGPADGARPRDVLTGVKGGQGSEEVE